MALSLTKDNNIQTNSTFGTMKLVTIITKKSYVVFHMDFCSTLCFDQKCDIWKCTPRVLFGFLPECMCPVKSCCSIGVSFHLLDSFIPIVLLKRDSSVGNHSFLSSCLN